MRDVITVQELAGDRFDLALDQLVDGLGFVVDAVWVRIDPDRGLCVEAVIGSRGPKYYDRAVQEALKRARSTMNRLRDASSRFVEIADAHDCCFAVIEDLGNSTIEVCREQPSGGDT